MDLIVELIKAAVTLGGLFVVLIIAPILFIVVFSFATSLDSNLDRDQD